MKSGTVAGSWAGRTGAGAGAGSSAGRASSSSARRMRCWSWESSGRGSTPSSSASSRMGVGVHRERLRLAAAAVQGDHEEFAQPFTQRVRGGQRGQFGDRLRVAADLQVQVQAGLGELESPLLQPAALILGVRAGHGGQSFAVPQAERLVEQGAGLGAVAGRTGLVRLCHQFLGHRQVEGVAPGPDRVSTGVADQRPRVEDLPEPGGIRAYRGERLRGRVLAPDGVDELGGGGGTAAAQEQCRQQGALLR